MEISARTGTKKSRAGPVQNLDNLGPWNPALSSMKTTIIGKTHPTHYETELKFIETESHGQFWINDYEAIFVGNQLIDGLICLFFSYI